MLSLGHPLPMAKGHQTPGLGHALLWVSRGTFCCWPGDARFADAYGQVSRYSFCPCIENRRWGSHFVFAYFTDGQVGDAAPHPVFTCTTSSREHPATAGWWTNLGFPIWSVPVLRPWAAWWCVYPPAAAVWGTGNEVPHRIFFGFPLCRRHKLTSCHWVWSKSRGPHYDSPGLPFYVLWPQKSGFPQGFLCLNLLAAPGCRPLQRPT